MSDMADAANARRDARRRKILENSHNRLKLISGKTGDESFQEFMSTTIPDKNCDNRVSVESVNNYSFSNGIISEEFLPIDLPLIDGDNGPGENHPINDLPDLRPLNSEKSQTSPLLEKIVNYRYDVVLLSLVIQLLFSLSALTFENSYFFLPLILYSITKLMLFPKPNNYNFANALLLLNGVSSSKIQLITTVTQWLEAISQDICIFLFTTVSFQAVCLFIKEMVN